MKTHFVFKCRSDRKVSSVAFFNLVKWHSTPLTFIWLIGVLLRVVTVLRHRKVVFNVWGGPASILFCYTPIRSFKHCIFLINTLNFSRITTSKYFTSIIFYMRLLSALSNQLVNNFSPGVACPDLITQRIVPVCNKAMCLLSGSSMKLILRRGCTRHNNNVCEKVCTSFQYHLFDISS